MRYLHALFPLALVMLITLPARAQRDVNTSSARAAYSALRAPAEHKVKKKETKKKKIKTADAHKKRKRKMKDTDFARARESLRHF